MIKIKYFFRDESGETETRKSFSEDITDAIPSIDLMFSTFKIHLKNCGYTEELIKEFADIHFGE